MKTRLLSLLALAAAFCASAWADDLRICPSCGREDEAGLEKCAACGATLPPVKKAEAPAVVAPEVPAASSSATNAFAEASRDVAEARRCRTESPERALVLYENALALLSAEAGGDFNAKAAAAVAKEIEALRVETKARTPVVSARRLMRQRATSEAVIFFKSIGRVSCGRAWVPAGWLDNLEPPQIAAVRQTLPPLCRECAGMGFETCRSCNGRGKQTCKNNGCNQGWIYDKSANDLSPKTALKTRHKCPVCNGTTFAPCDTCNGSGAVLCRKCGGSGEAPTCTSCHGSGLMDCRECKRSTYRKTNPDEKCRVCKGTHQALCTRCGGDGRIAK